MMITYTPRVRYLFEQSGSSWMVTKTFVEFFFKEGIGPSEYVWATRPIGMVSDATKRKMETWQNEAV